MSRFTYKNRMGWINIRNVKAVKGQFKGQITKFNTKNGIPVMIPDEWFKDGHYVQYIPEGMYHYKMGIDVFEE